ncbi:sulfite exporter TauE/SafE family protein [Enterococcus asini]|uniref:sulfite exporter TauE/SafE family protein n=1 Tax=Enterococcus asini TaxID=57732 RepID=UPI0028902A45|nr:sulfite exporter TauE/SafE family protein [Enterococcus asini]MDT2757456.1 sulfite exporter TauE/SafE family protein [Enterococcus asini]
MIGLLYFVIIIFANTIGAISGMGGGVLIKPLFDAIGADSVPAITFYSTVAVFTMSIVSTLRQRKNMTIDYSIASLVSLGAVLGGIGGNLTFEALLQLLTNEKSVQLIQILLTILTIGFSYIVSGSQWRLGLKGRHWYVIVGLLLGFLASLLGIGGGPINVALLLLCFGMNMKAATVYSIITIFFSQLAKIVTISTTTGFSRYDLHMLYYVIPAAIIGGFLGAFFSGRLKEDYVRRVYQVVLFLVLCINAYNGIQILFG